MRKLLALTLAVILNTCAVAQAQNQPPHCGTIANKQYTNSEWTAGLEYTDYIRPGTPGACEAPGGNTCYWVDCDAVSDGTGTFASPFWGFETVAGWCTGDGCISSGDFTQGLAVAGDWIYVKGTCDTFTENATGPYQGIRLLRRAQHGSQAEPTVITSWADEVSPIFDGGFTEYNLMHFQGSVGGGTAGYVDVNNVRITRYASKGIEYHSDVLGGTVNSVEVYNGAANGEDGVGGGVVFYADSLLHDFRLTNSYFWDLNANPSGSTNNRGAVTVLAESTATAGSQVQIANVIVADVEKGIRHKHNGPVTTVVTQSLIYDVVDAFYVRQPLNVQKVVIQDATRSAFYISEENYSVAIPTIVDKITAVEGSRFFLLDDGNGGVLNSTVTATNSIWEDASGANRTWCLDCFGAVTPSTWNFSDITHDNNMYNITAGAQSPIFAELDGNTYTFAAFMTGVGDGVSIVDDAELEADCGIGVSSPGASFATDGGPIGAIGFGGGGSAPIVTINSKTTSVTSPSLSGTVSDPTATIAITVDGNGYTGVNNGNGTWSLAAGLISPALTVGTYDVEVDATNGFGTGSDATVDELEIVAGGGGSESSWVGSFLRRICRWCF